MVKDKHDTTDKGLFSNLMRHGSGGYYHSSYANPSHGCYPPQCCPPSGAGYAPYGGYSYPPTAYPAGGHAPVAHPYPSPSYHLGYGPNIGTMLAGGAAGAAAAYGAHHLSHGHGHYGHGYHGRFKHGKFGKRWKHHGLFGRGKYKCWK